MKKTELSIKGVPSWLLILGINSLLLILVGLGFSGALYLVGFSSAISIPFIVAAFLAIVAFPIVKFFDRIKIPRTISSIIVILVLVAIIIIAVQITVVGIIDQAPAIGEQLQNGLYDLGRWLGSWLAEYGIDQTEITQFSNNLSKTITDFFVNGDGWLNLQSSVEDNAGSIAQSFGNWLSSGSAAVMNLLGNIGAGVFGIFVGIMLLYYMLSDYEKLSTWIGSHLGVSPELGASLVEDSTEAFRHYMKGTTIINFVVAIGVGVGLAIFKVNLIIPIMIVTFIMGYIPFIGAIFSSAFAFVLAFASGGISAALAALVIVILMQNVLQTFIQSKVLGETLDMHPIIVLVSTLVGSVFAGLLGAMLATPVVSMALRIYDRMKKARVIDEAGGGIEELRSLLETGTFPSIVLQQDSDR